MTITFNDLEVKNLPITGKDIEELILLSQADLILKSHLITEQLLDTTLSLLLGSNSVFDGCRIRYAEKIKVAKNLGVPATLIAFLKRLNNIRNKFAHDLRHDITTKDIEELKGLHNSCFTNDIGTVSDESQVHLTAKIQIGNEVIVRNLKFKYSEATRTQKAMVILTRFIGQKFIAFLVQLQEDTPLLEKIPGNRLENLKNQMATYTG